MSDKLNQFDDEVAVNEDVNDIQDLGMRSHNRALEGMHSYNTNYDYGSSTYFFPLCIFGGFDVTFAADGSLDFAIGNGEALIAHDETTESDGNVWTSGHFDDQYKRNNVQQARHSTAQSGTYPYSITSNTDPSKDRIDIIEIRFDRVETSENRYKLVTIDNRRVQQLTSVDKYVEYVMSDVRVRLGVPVAPPSSPSYSYGPRMPALDPNVGSLEQWQWLPIAAVYVPASTTGFSSQPTITDLRLFYQPKMANGLLNGPFQPVNVSTYGYGPSGGPWDQWISVGKNAICDGGLCFPISGSSKYSNLENPLIGWIPFSVNTEYHSFSVCDDAWPIDADTMYYLYSYRASARVGYTGICISSVAPSGGLSATYGKSGNPSALITPPTPWPDRHSYTNPSSPTSGTLGDYVMEHAHYLTSFKCFEDASSVMQPRPFKRQGNYTSLVGYGYDLSTYSPVYADTYDDNIIFQGTIDGGSGLVQEFQIQAFTDPPYDGSNTPGTRKVIPMHASCMNLEITTITLGTGSANLYFFSEEGENVPAGDGNVFLASILHASDNDSSSIGKKQYLEMPLQAGYNTLFWLVVSLSSTCQVQLTIRVRGYYEQF